MHHKVKTLLDPLTVNSWTSLNFVRSLILHIKPNGWVVYNYYLL